MLFNELMFIIFAGENKKPRQMARPKRQRKMYSPPVMQGYKPFGMPAKQIGEVILLFEEYEAIHLCDYQKLTHEDAAKRMAVSRPTFTRIYENARKNIAKALVEGSAIFMEVGDVIFDEIWVRCHDCRLSYKISEANDETRCPECTSDNYSLINTENEKDMKKKDANETLNMGSGGFCICVRCDVKIPHRRGVPCREHRCPECNRPMLREGGYHHQKYLEKKSK